MKIVVDKYGRYWLKKRSTYTLLTSLHLAILNLKKIVLVLFISVSCYSQTSIVSAGNKNETFGEVFPLIQQLDTIESEVPLGVPKFEVEQPKPIIKKKPKSFLEKLITFIKNLINKNK